jgi:hypothetical protein
MNDSNRVRRRPRRLLPLALRVAPTIVAVAGLAMLAAACGGSNKVASVGSSFAGGSSNAPSSASTSSHEANDVPPAQHGQLESAYLGFAKCMRSHEVGDFPDPVTGTGGHPGFYLQGGSNSDLNANSAAFQRGVEACQRILGHEFRFAFMPSGVGKGA